MIIESLGAALILAFGAVAIFGHVLLVRAAFTPAKGDNSGSSGECPSHRAELARVRIAA